MYDVIVVGARCAGAPLAMLLARAGHRVALLDRASFPSDTMSTHFLWQRGAARLSKWGLLDRLRERGCAPISEITFDAEGIRLQGIGPAVGGVADAYCPRRTVLDALLVEAAVEAGAELVEGFSVRDIEWSEGRASGVCGRARASAGVSLRAALVIGCDGLHSTIARQVGARVYRQQPSLTAVYYSYWSGIGARCASFHARPGQLILVWPTNDELTCVYVAWPRQELARVRTDIEGHFLAALQLVPGLRERVAGGRREERYVGTGDLPNQYRNSAGPGWALAGDAGYHRDPATGMGISDAFLGAELLAEAIQSSLTGRRPTDAALADYQRRRDHLTTGGYQLALSTARLQPVSPRLAAFYQAASPHAELVEQIFAVLGGSLPLRDVYPQQGEPANEQRDRKIAHRRATRSMTSRTPTERNDHDTTPHPAPTV